jgi:hypothetical protein
MEATASAGTAVVRAHTMSALQSGCKAQNPLSREEVESQFEAEFAKKQQS